MIEFIFFKGCGGGIILVGSGLNGIFTPRTLLSLFFFFFLEAPGKLMRNNDNKCSVAGCGNSLVLANSCLLQVSSLPVKILIVA
jgi:hypothetical protein